MSTLSNGGFLVYKGRYTVLQSPKRLWSPALGPEAGKTTIFLVGLHVTQTEP